MTAQENMALVTRNLGAVQAGIDKLNARFLARWCDDLPRSTPKDAKDMLAAEPRVLNATRVRMLATAATSKWAGAPIVDDPRARRHVPKPIQRALTDQGGPVAGLLLDGVLYLAAESTAKPLDVLRVVAANTLPRSGLRAIYGAVGVAELLAARPDDVRRMAEQAGLPAGAKNLGTAAELLLVELAATEPRSGFALRAVAAVGRWMADLGVKAPTDAAEVVRDFILPAGTGANQEGSQLGDHTTPRA